MIDNKIMRGYCPIPIINQYSGFFSDLLEIGVQFEGTDEVRLWQDELSVNGKIIEPETIFNVLNVEIPAIY